MALFEGWWAFTLVCLGVGFYTIYSMLKFTNWKKTAWYVLAFSWIGWFFSFFFVFLFPFDVASSVFPDCPADSPDCYQPKLKIAPQVLYYSWMVIYWSNFILCWVLYPVVQCYAIAGEFYMFRRIWRALKENLIFYGASGVACVVILIAVIVTTGIHSFSDLYAIGIAAGTAWGIFVLFLLLGYGLTEVPKKLWGQASKLYVLRDFYMKAASKKDALEKAKKELTETLKLVKSYDKSIGVLEKERPHIDTILKYCPPEYLLVDPEGEVDRSYSSLVKLNERLKYAVQEVAIAQSYYQRLLRKCYKLEDILRATKYSEKVIIWTVPKDRSPNMQKYMETWEYYWLIHLQPFFFRVLAILCGLFSLIVIWSEITFWVRKVNLSIFSLILNSPAVQNSFGWRMFFTFVPIFYMATCCYWSFFQIKISTYFRLVPSATDPYSLITSASYLCRLGAPLAYNFLLMTYTFGDNDSTEFRVVMGTLKNIPLLGDTLHIYFPIFLLIFATANVFDLYSKVILMFKRQATIEKNLQEGQEIISHERELYLNSIKRQLPPMAKLKIPMTEIELEVATPWRAPVQRNAPNSSAIASLKEKYMSGNNNNNTTGNNSSNNNNNNNSNSKNETSGGKNKGGLGAFLNRGSSENEMELGLLGKGEKGHSRNNSEGSSSKKSGRFF